MKTILISPPSLLPQETELINMLFDQGMDYFHIRKPDFSKEETEAYLKSIKPFHYRKISIHGHYSLIEKYNLGGIHIPEKLRSTTDVKAITKAARKRNLSVSTSIHSLNTLEETEPFDYVFLSPVFDSISKKEYHGSIDLSEFLFLKQGKKTNRKVIALGGITPGNVDKALGAGFDGVALLGYIWNDFELHSTKEVFSERYMSVKKAVSEHLNV